MDQFTGRNIEGCDADFQECKIVGLCISTSKYVMNIVLFQEDHVSPLTIPSTSEHRMAKGRNGNKFHTIINFFFMYSVALPLEGNFI